MTWRGIDAMTSAASMARASSDELFNLADAQRKIQLDLDAMDSPLDTRTIYQTDREFPAFQQIASNHHGLTIIRSAPNPDEGWQIVAWSCAKSTPDGADCDSLKRWASAPFSSFKDMISRQLEANRWDLGLSFPKAEDLEIYPSSRRPEFMPISLKAQVSTPWNQPTQPDTAYQSSPVPMGQEASPETAMFTFALSPEAMRAMGDARGVETFGDGKGALRMSWINLRSGGALEPTSSGKSDYLYSVATKYKDVYSEKSKYESPQIQDEQPQITGEASPVERNNNR
jgi:hypothetical protein